MDRLCRFITNIPTHVFVVWVLGFFIWTLFAIGAYTNGGDPQHVSFMFVIFFFIISIIAFLSIMFHFLQWLKERMNEYCWHRGQKKHEYNL